MARLFLHCALLLLALSPAVLACESAVDLIKSAEGYRACEYKDTRGIPVRSIGFVELQAELPARP